MQLRKNLLPISFMNMIRFKGSIENDIALYIKKMLGLYNLPSIFELFNNPPFKTEWKRIMNNVVNNTIEAN